MLVMDFKNKFGYVGGVGVVSSIQSFFIDFLIV